MNRRSPNKIGKIDEYFPKTYDDLDVFERVIYVGANRWKMSVANSRCVEPFKVLKNRTIVEAIRRRRNDPFWCSSVDNEIVKRELLQCWGMGDKKVERSESLILIDFLDTISAFNLFEKSRTNI